MDRSGSVEVAATRAAVWALLMDIDRLAQCGPDVDSIERLDASHSRIRTTVKLGFFRSGVTIDLELAEINAPDHIAMRGDGEASGNRVEATGDVTLSGPASGPTTIAWTADLHVTGPLAGMASRMIEDAASTVIDDTMACIRATLAPG